MSATSAIHEYLREAHVPYTAVPHPAAFTAQDEAASMHIPGRNVAKVVACFVDGEPVQAVVPATLVVNLDRLRELTGGHYLRLAEEHELRDLFPGCESGAMPPLGPLYAQTTFVDLTLAAEREIVFSAGTHVDAIAMRWADFARTVRPIVGDFAEMRRDRVPAYHLSRRE